MSPIQHAELQVHIVPCFILHSGCMNIKTIMNGMADSKHIKCAQNCITNNTDNLMTEDSIPVECIL